MRLYVGNLPFKTTDEELRDFFSSIGTVENASVVRDRDTGRSRGFGFVEMADEDGKKAIDQLHGQKMGDRDLVVNEARPMTPGGGSRNFR